jgi:DeoR/GlpR family transcriptional regulator of sugar metabolism
MLIPQRQTRLQELLARRGMSDLESLASALKVSLSTVRRDIEALSGQGLVKRTHGGAIWVGGAESTARPHGFDQRQQHHVKVKRQIADAAREFVGAGETIIIDGGTTTWFFARTLVGRDVQIVTNSLPIAQQFMNDEHAELVLLGGTLYPRYGVLLGPTTEQALDGLHARTLFLSVWGIHHGALYNQNLLLIQAEQRMMQRVQQVVLLADSSKFGHSALARLCTLDAIHVVVTDAGLTKEHREPIEKAGCKLIIAS